MTKEQKSNSVKISVGFILAIAITYGAWINSVKADRTDLIPIKEQLQKSCEKQEKIDEVLIDLRLDVKEIKTLLKDKK